MPEYSALALLGSVAIVVYELKIARTGIFAKKSYWIGMAIVFFFQVLVDGWLTKLSAPIVIYDDAQTIGVRFPFDIPVEDFLFGFALTTLAIINWVRLAK